MLPRPRHRAAPAAMCQIRGQTDPVTPQWSHSHLGRHGWPAYTDSFACLRAIARNRRAPRVRKRRATRAAEIAAHATHQRSLSTHAAHTSPHPWSAASSHSHHASARRSRHGRQCCSSSGEISSRASIDPTAAAEQQQPAAQAAAGPAVAGCPGRSRSCLAARLWWEV
jgi:hypothetical protein